MPNTNFAPKGLSTESRALWRSVSSTFEMDAAGLLMLKEACLTLDRLRQAQEILKKEGVTYLDRFGQLRAHPAVNIERDSRGQLLKCLQALNLDLDDSPVGAPVARI
jgi:P27 family predicted phage terminase small subunit